MPKMKTHRAAAKRFKRTASGKLKRRKAYKSHILAKKTRHEPGSSFTQRGEKTKLLRETVSGTDFLAIGVGRSAERQKRFLTPFFAPE